MSLPLVNVLGKVIAAVAAIVVSLMILYVSSKWLKEKVGFIRKIRGTEFTDIDLVDGGSVVKITGTAKETDGTVPAPLNDADGLVYKYEEQHWDSDANTWETKAEDIDATAFTVEGADGGRVSVVGEPSRVLATDMNTERTFEGNPEKADVGVDRVGATVVETHDREVQKLIADGDDVVVYGEARDTSDGVVIGGGLGSEELVVMDAEQALPTVRGVVLRYVAAVLFVVFVLVVSVSSLL